MQKSNFRNILPRSFIYIGFIISSMAIVLFIIRIKKPLIVLLKEQFKNTNLSNLIHKIKCLKLFIILLLSFCLGSYLYNKQLNRQTYFDRKTVHKNKFTAYVENIKSVESNQFKFRTTAFLEEEHERVFIFSRIKPKCAIGDYIEIEKLSFTPVKNEEFRHYLLKENIASCSYTTQLDTKVLNHPHFHLSRFLEKIREKIVARVESKLDSLTFVLWKSLFLGEKDKKTILEPIKTSCKKWGITHYLARSGFHLMLFIALWTIFLKGIPIVFWFKQIILGLLVLLYALLSVPSVSFIRALITFFLYKVCILTKLEIQPMYIVNLACLLTLLHNPAQLFYLDFQLSYTLALAITLFHEISFQQKLLLQK